MTRAEPTEYDHPHSAGFFKYQSNHQTLASLLDSKRLSEDDLILLLSSSYTHFTPLEVLVEETLIIADKYKVNVSNEFCRTILTKPRHEVYESVDSHIEGFARCGIEPIDRWADEFRVEKRMSLSRVVLLLNTSQDAWLKPNKHDYAVNILKFFEKRMINTVLRGPLVRLTISKSSSRIDITELGTELKTANQLLTKIIQRSVLQKQIDPMSFAEDPLKERRTRRMLTKAQNYRRDTGIDSLFVGFPFLVSQVSKQHRPRIMPILLWPVAMDGNYTRNRKYTLAFDKEREEVRINPALEKEVGPDEFKKWLKVHKEILGREPLSIDAVIDAFGTLAQVSKSSLTAHPSVSYKLKEVGLEISPSAVLFNANFAGQTISEDIRQLQKLPHSNTAMESLLRISEVEIKEAPKSCSEIDRFTVAHTDPSQEQAVFQSREFPGMLVEGPPGTGKSQTIVNIIADCIGRHETVLVVCQKQAALRVVQKRLEAENLENRIISVVDINRDRQGIIRALKEQVPAILKSDETDLSQIKNKRKNW